MARKVLIVEDDNNIAELLHLYLEKEGFETQVAPDGGKGVELYRSFHPELVLLDIMLPVMDGWSVLKKIRETDKTPVILLTAKGETNDKVQGLEGGADDYIVKPFEMKEVLARIHAVLRRYGAENGESEKKLSFDKLVINLDSYELVVDGRRIDTPPKELELLYHLAASPQPGVHPQSAPGRGVGLRLLWRLPHGGRAHQAAAGEAGGRLRPVVPEDGLGRGL